MKTSIDILLAAATTQPSLIAPPTSPSTSWSSCLVSGDVATIGCFAVIFQRFVVGALMLSGITAAILIAYSGVRMILAQGDAKKLEGAQHTLTFAIIGLIVVFLAAFIVSVIAYIANVPCLNVAGFTNCSNTPSPIRGM